MRGEEMNTRVAKTLFEIAYVNVLFVIVGVLVALPILLIAIVLFDLITGPVDNDLYPCSPVPFDGCE
jgi:hypothetical protein